MPKYNRCGPDIQEMATEILEKFETHRPLLDSRVTIDFLFAYGEQDENGMVTSHAITKNGVQALGLCRKMSLKDRAAGRADAEIILDGDWWAQHDREEQMALLDHELHHIEVVPGETDDLGRPKIKMRKHDYDIGWFRVIAARHGRYSQERVQAEKMMEDSGQYFWPDLAEPNVLKAHG